MQSFAVSLPSMTVSPIHLAGTPHIVFETWVDRSPDSIAVTWESGTLTYRELEQRANQVAHALRSFGVQRGDIVALFLERGPDLVCALLGVLKAGAAFVAMDPKTPKQVLTRELASLDCRLLLSCDALISGLPTPSTQLLSFDHPDWLDSQSASRLLSMVCPEDPSCVLFTSGSSGSPKAVLYLNRNLSVRLSNTMQLSRFDQFSVFAQSSPVSSIDAIDEILLPLVTGGCTAILSYDTVTNPHRLIDSLSHHGVTHILLVPSLLRVMLSSGGDLNAKVGSLKVWMSGGEPLTPALTRQFYEQLPTAVLINFYGLTEGDGTFHITSATSSYETGVPIGRPVAATKVYLLDEGLNPVSDGESGEICLAGEALSHQYLNSSELNAKRWVPNPFSVEDPYARLFRTGDMGRLRPDGEIEYVGRRDRQVKVRGFRVELGEIEAALAQHPAVDQCVAVSRQPSVNEGVTLLLQTNIVVYAVLKHGKMASAHELHGFLRDHLPEQARPSMIFLVDSLPLSPNGKVDFNALAQLVLVEKQRSKTYVPPRSALEVRLAQLWEKLLNVSPIGVADDFFEIGGDSLSAIDLMLSIEKEFQHPLPITVLIQSPTIATLAEVLGGDRGSIPRGSLVPIRAQGSRPPLFCVHADGSVFIYRRFAEHLDQDIPIYGLQAHGLAHPQDQPYRHVHEMAAHYVREIRTVQPHGPYHLCAFSAGGLIIFEMARQMRGLGENVAFVGMLDAYGPDYPDHRSPKSLVTYKMSVHLNTLRLHGIKGQARYLFRRGQHRLDLIASKLFAVLFSTLRLPMPRKTRYNYIARLIEHAAELYPRDNTYEGDVVLFHASSQPEGIKPDRTLGWGALVKGELKIVDVPGTHHSIMMHAPHVAELVRKIDGQLQQLHNP